MEYVLAVKDGQKRFWIENPLLIQIKFFSPMKRVPTVKIFGDHAAEPEQIELKCYRLEFANALFSRPSVGSGMDQIKDQSQTAAENWASRWLKKIWENIKMIRWEKNWKSISSSWKYVGFAQVTPWVLNLQRSRREQPKTLAAWSNRSTSTPRDLHTGALHSS